MAAASNIVLADGQATPVNHTFVPLGPDANGVWWFEDQSAAVPLGNNRLSVELKRPMGGRQGEDASKRVVRVKVGIHTPKLETVSNNTVSGIAPAPTISYVPRVNIEFILPERSAVQDREDIRLFASSVLLNAHVIAAVETLQGIW